jgi:sulfate permease, SulP family
LPAGGSLGGTELLVKGGARSRWANILTGVMAAIMILLFAGFISRIALPALAGLLMVVGFQTIKFGEIDKVWHTSSTSRTLMIATFNGHADRALTVGGFLRCSCVICHLCLL